MSRKKRSRDKKTLQLCFKLPLVNDDLLRSNIVWDAQNTIKHASQLVSTLFVVCVESCSQCREKKNLHSKFNVTSTRHSRQKLEFEGFSPISSTCWTKLVLRREVPLASCLSFFKLQLKNCYGILACFSFTEINKTNLSIKFL